MTSRAGRFNGHKSNSSLEFPKSNRGKQLAFLTINPGDRITKDTQTIEEKAQQIAVDVPDITGDWIKVPTYFIVQYPNGQKKALHHVRDAKEISDVIRQARFEQEEWQPNADNLEQLLNLNLTGLIFILAMLAVTIPILMSVF